MSRRKLSKVVSVVSANLALLGAAHLAFGELGCRVAASQQQEEQQQEESIPRSSSTTNDPDRQVQQLLGKMTPEQRAWVEQNFASDPRNKEAKRITNASTDGGYFEVIRPSAFAARLSRFDKDGHVVITRDVATEMPRAQRLAIYSEVTGKAVAPSTFSGAMKPNAIPTDGGMPLGDNGACDWALAAVALDVTIIVLATAELALMHEALAFYIASTTAALLGTTMTVEIMAAASVQAWVILGEISAVLATIWHIWELANNHPPDAAMIASVGAEVLEKLGLLGHGMAGGVAALIAVINFLISFVNDILTAVANCTAKPLPPPENGNPSFTTVGCNQSGGFGANFNPSLAWAACRGVISNWKTDYSRYGLNYWTCGELLAEPDQSPDHTQLCNNWIQMCVAATRQACTAPGAGGAGAQPPPPPPPGPMPVADAAVAPP